MDNNIFGYDWQEIQAKQQGKSISKMVVGKSASVQCFSCGKYFNLNFGLKDKLTRFDFPVKCLHCGYTHEYDAAKDNCWPFIA